MKRTSQSGSIGVGSSSTFLFGPFPIGDILERINVDASGHVPLGTKGTLSVAAGQSGGKDAADVRLTGSRSVFGLVAADNAGDCSMVLLCWQKIEGGTCYVSVAVSAQGFDQPVDCCVSVAVRPAWKALGFRDKGRSVGGYTPLNPPPGL